MAPETDSTTLRKKEKPTSQLNPLTALSSVDGRYWNQTEVLSPYFSEAALIRTRVEIEAKYLLALSEVKVKDGTGPNLVRPLQPKEKEMLLQLGPTLSDRQVERIKQIEITTKHDVKAMERGLREILTETSLKDVVEAEAIHFALTSEDVNNLAYRLMLERARKDVMIPAAEEVVNALVNLAYEYRGTPMLARTHGQPAVPTTLGKELINLAVRTQTQINELQKLHLTGKLNGAIGNYNAHVFTVPDVDWISFSEDFVKGLGLNPNLFTTQINTYDDITRVMQAFQVVNGTILDIDRDMWRYISDGWFVQQVKSGEVGSSTMPQKVNPIQFEKSAGNLEFATDMLGSMGRILATSRLQRDLENSTVIRNLGETLARCLVAYISTVDGLQRIKPDLGKLKSTLNADYFILTEAVQTVLRRARTADPYSLVASLSHGQNINQDEWEKWIRNLPVDIDNDTREKLIALKPEIYIGLAEELTERGLKEITRLRE